MLLHKVRGFAFRLTGLILGIIGAVVSITSIVFSTIGMVKAANARRDK
jgi:hypothetical protein